jgi:hypothetical protein
MGDDQIHSDAMARGLASSLKLRDGERRRCLQPSIGAFGFGPFVAALRTTPRDRDFYRGEHVSDRRG